MQWRAQRKIKRGRDEESLWKKERCHTTWRREDSKISGAKSRHLRCYPPKIRLKNESSQVSQNHSCRISLLFKIQCVNTWRKGPFILEEMTWRAR